MQPLQKTLNAFLLVTLSSHFFCCVVPMVFSLASLLTGLGFITMASTVEEFHHHMHAFELPILVFSFVMLFLGWGIEWYRHHKHVNCCHHTGCDHEPCTPKKKRAHTFLVIATLLFLVNLAIYLGENIL